ncbi:AMP-binding protein [Actinoplanes sp. TBRC 11911]|uniref:AMP-binding protein n=1 Tax=Actinoplanes sp. TBRC 11911 TaxID=2729386 RepID=UPI00145F62DB|nr:AMP-binding protein [Actinoplanes sp. TBRC 11911]NMO52913.1 AMP-binding protein [Actinoplanes sp. TBRC 11911]
MHEGRIFCSPSERGDSSCPALWDLQQELRYVVQRVSARPEPGTVYWSTGCVLDATRRYRFTKVRARDADIARHRETGAWRSGSILTDLWDWRDRTPNATAVVAYCSDGRRVQLSYREYADRVDRFAAAFVELGARFGSVVAVQLPEWWQAGALVLAAIRAGAVVTPISVTLGARDTERILRRVGASMYIGPGTWDGTDYPARIAESATRLPMLRHRIVVGSPTRPPEINFAHYFEREDWRRRHAATLAGRVVDPDRAAIVAFTTGNDRGAVHSLNTIYGDNAEIVRTLGLGPGDRIHTPHTAMHKAGFSVTIGYPLLAGACNVLVEGWTPAAGAAAVTAEGVTHVVGVPMYLTALFGALRNRGGDVSTLRVVVSFGAAVTPQLVTATAVHLGVPLLALFSTTEAGGIHTRPDDPADWSLNSVGRPARGTEFELRSEEPISEAAPGRLLLRGAAVCLATLDTTTTTPVGEWFDTGDLAVPDGRSGVRLVERATGPNRRCGTAGTLRARWPTWL